MSIRTFRTVEIECDVCGICENSARTQAEVVKQFREEGWTIGKRVLCPEHSKQASSKEGEE